MEFGRYAEFLTRLADDGLVRVFARFDMTAGRQPQAGLAMIPEEQAAVGRVDGDEVDNEMLRRRGRRGRPEELLSRGNPPENVGLVGCLAHIAGLDCRHKFRDESANIAVWHWAILAPRRLRVEPGVKPVHRAMIEAPSTDGPSHEVVPAAQPVTRSGGETVT